MSAIGDYIHYHKSNYETWGINRKNSSPGENWAIVADKFKKQLLNIQEIKSLMTETAALEKRYNELFYPTKDISQETRVFRDAMNAAIQQRLNEEFQLSAATFNPDNLTAEPNELYNKMQSAIKKTQSEIQKVEISKAKTAGEMLSRVEALEKVLGSKNFKSIKEAEAALSESQTKLQEIKKTVEAQVNQKGSKSAVRLNSNDVQTLKGIIKQWNRCSTLSNQSGVLFEWLLPLIQLQSLRIGKQEIKNEMLKLTKDSSVVRGDVQVKIEMPDLQDSAITDVDILTDKIKMKTFTTTSKTDVQITYEDELTKTTETKNVSAKNVTANLNPHLVNDTTLYNVLLLSNNNNFATHYLNIVTAASNEKSSPEKILQANRLIKGLILKFAAEGYDATSASEILVINNQQEKRIYIFNLKVLIYLVQYNILNGGDYADAVSLKDSYTINQNYDPKSADKRIINVIRSTNSQKINARLRENMFSSYFSFLKSYGIQT